MIQALSLTISALWQWNERLVRFVHQDLGADVNLRVQWKPNNLTYTILHIAIGIEILENIHLDG
jgi:hypothetical protein